MHNELPLTTKYVIEELNAMTEKLPAFWERLFICKEKGDKASNTICMPPPPMKGSYGPVVSFYMPTAEEQKQYIDDFNKYIDDLINDTNAYFEHVSEVQKLIYDDEEDPDTSESLFYQVDRLYHKLFDKDKNSIDILKERGVMNERKCKRYGMNVLKRIMYLVMCGKNYMIY